MASRKHLIIGCGPAALAALQKIRETNTEDEVKLVCMGACPPYSPAALPYIISGKAEEARLWLRDEDYFRRMRASLVQGVEVASVHPEKKEITYADGSREHYDTLLIASGSEPIKPAIEGLDEAGFVAFHTLGDCRQLLQRLEGEKDVAINGGGLVAMELAAALLGRGCGVKVIVRSRILRRYVNQEVGAIIQDIFREKGAQFYQGAEVSRVKKEGDRIQIVLSDGRTLNADLLVNSVGVKPKTGFLKGTGIEVRSGVLIDSKAMTNLPNIYAAGDVAEGKDFFTGERGPNPILASAISQGNVAGANMSGQEAQDSGWIAMNVFKFFDHSLCSIGLAANKTCQIKSHADHRNRQFKELVFLGDKLVGARFLDVEVDPGVMRYVIEKGLNLKAYGEALFESPKDVSRWLMLRSERQDRELVGA